MMGNPASEPVAARGGQRRSIAQTLLALAAVGAGVLGLWFRFNAAPPEAGRFFPYDLLYYYYPITVQAAERLARGELPLWNPHACNGIPLLATLQVGVFYPWTWLAVLIPAERAIPARMLLETMLGSAFTYGFFRARKGGRPAAVAGAVLYAFVCQLGQSFWPAALSVLTWLPWLLLCVEKLAQSWRWRWWIGLGLGTALQIFAGFPQYVVYSFYAVAPFAVLRQMEVGAAKQRSATPTIARLTGVALAVVLGAGIASVQILPTLELARESHRGGSLAPAETQYLGPQTSISSFLANTVAPFPKLIAFGYGGDTGYVGIAALLLAALGVVTAARRSETWFWLALGVVGLLLSGGYRGPTSTLYEIYARIPTGNMFRTPERLQLLPLFSLIVLSVQGLDSLRTPPGPGRRRRIAVGALVAITGLAIWFGGAGVAWRALAALALIGVALFSASPGLRAGMPFLLVTLVIADAWLGTASVGSLRAIPTQWTDRLHLLGHTVLAPEQIGSLVAEKWARSAWIGIEPPNPTGPLGGLDRPDCLEPLRPRAMEAVSRRLSTLEGAEIANRGQVRISSFYDVASVGRALVPLRIGPGLDYDARVALRNFIEKRIASGEGPDPAPLAGEPFGTEVIENEDALPRTYVVKEYEVQPLAATLERVLSGSFDIRRSVLLDRFPGTLPAAPGRAARSEKAVIVQYTPERVEIESDASSHALLILTDSYYPGWRASVDGAATEILRANGLFRAIRIPGGSHRVVFEYAPASLRRGAVLSAVSLGALTLTGIAGSRLRARPKLRLPPAA